MKVKHTFVGDASASDRDPPLSSSSSTSYPHSPERDTSSRANNRARACLRCLYRVATPEWFVNGLGSAVHEAESSKKATKLTYYLANTEYPFKAKILATFVVHIACPRLPESDTSPRSKA